MKCNSWGFSIEGCYYWDENMDLREMQLGETKDVHIWRFECLIDKNNNMRVHYGFYRNLNKTFINLLHI